MQLERYIEEKQLELDSVLPQYQEKRDEEEQLKARCLFVVCVTERGVREGEREGEEGVCGRH